MSAYGRMPRSHANWLQPHVDSGAVGTVEVTAANEADKKLLPKLLWPEDEVISADAGDTSDEYKRGSRKLGMRWRVQDKRKAGQGRAGQVRICRRVRRSATASSPRYGRGWSMCSGDQAAIRIHQNPLPGAGEERSPGQLWVGVANWYMLRGWRMVACGQNPSTAPR
jgi:IS5 family transposase